MVEKKENYSSIKFLVDIELNIRDKKCRKLKGNNSAFGI